MDDWKAIRVGLSEDREAPVELFNLAVNIGENQNVADRHPEIVQKMKRLMEKSHVEDRAWPFVNYE